MTPEQQKAIDIHRKELVQIPFDSFADHILIEGLITNDDYDSFSRERKSVRKWNACLKLLKNKDKGWPTLLDFLKGQGMSSKASLLEGSVSPDNATSSPREVLFQWFRNELLEYYATDFCRVKMVHQDSFPISEIWIPPMLERGDRKSSYEPMEYNTLLKNFANESINFLLVEGDPGIGKTTLAKKIAYDWIQGQQSSDSNEPYPSPFGIVLVVPLRSVKSSESDFLSMAVKYFVGMFLQDPRKKAENRRFHETEIANFLLKFGKTMLICFDGLDEYTRNEESPFRRYFSPSFPSAKKNSSELPHIIKYKVLITSRPYACVQANGEFHSLKCRLTGVPYAKREEFVHSYCRDLGTKENVLSRITRLNLTESMLSNPLILGLICCVAKERKTVPETLSSLYKECFTQMLRTAYEGHKLKEDFVWKRDTVWNSLIVCSTASLAFDGLIELNSNNKLEFNEDELTSHGINEDNFAAGFLLYTFDYFSNEQKAEFQHSSIQEFFAAQHAINIMEKSDEIKDIKILEQSSLTPLADPNSQFGRFVFGLCSTPRAVETFLSHKNVVGKIGEIIQTSYGLPHFLHRFCSFALDCSVEKAAVLWQTLLNVLGKQDISRLRALYKQHILMSSWSISKVLKKLPVSLQASLHLLEYPLVIMCPSAAQSRLAIVIIDSPSDLDNHRLCCLNEQVDFLWIEAQVLVKKETNTEWPDVLFSWLQRFSQCSNIVIFIGWNYDFIDNNHAKSTSVFHLNRFCFSQYIGIRLPLEFYNSHRKAFKPKHPHQPKKCDPICGSYDFDRNPWSKTTIDWAPDETISFSEIVKFLLFEVELDSIEDFPVTEPKTAAKLFMADPGELCFSVLFSIVSLNRMMSFQRLKLSKFQLLRREKWIVALNQIKFNLLALCQTL